MKDNYFQGKKFIKNYIVAITIFILTLIMGIVIFFNGVSIAVEKNSKETLITNVARQSEHLNKILELNYSYLNALAENLTKSEDLFSKNNLHKFDCNGNCSFDNLNKIYIHLYIRHKKIEI